MAHRGAPRTIGRTVAAALLLATAACSSAGSSSDGGTAMSSSPVSPSSSPEPAAATGGYVALGDSYTAGPGIEPQQPDGGLCGRSSVNWPALLGRTLDLAVSDVSCSGATTADLASTVASGSVRSDAGLVTVSAGGNDGGLFLSLIRACTAGSDSCAGYARDRVPPVLERTTDDLSTLLGTVVEAAPQARVVLVGYPRIMPDAGGACQAVGIPAGDVPSVVASEQALDAALAAAADRAGVDFVSLRDAAAGHDACTGAEAWTNGVAPAAGDGIVFHPNVRGMQAVAGVVAAALDR